MTCGTLGIAGEIGVDESMHGQLFSDYCSIVRVCFVCVSWYVVRVELREVIAGSCYDGMGYVVLRGPGPDGKYRVEFSKLQLLSSFSLHVNIGHCQLQLVWLSTLHDAHFFLTESHTLVL